MVMIVTALLAVHVPHVQVQVNKHTIASSKLKVIANNRIVISPAQDTFDENTLGW